MSLARASAENWPGLAVLLLCAFSTPLAAAEPVPAGRTNEVSIPYSAPSIDLETGEKSSAFVDRFFQELGTGDRILFDRFTGPSSRLAWARKQTAFGYGAFDTFSKEGARMFSTIGMDSLRTAAVEGLPLEMWEDHWQGWFLDFILGTIGNPGEEHFGLTSISYSAVRSSWESANEKSGIQWGFRPWRTNPYLYVLATAGHLDGRPLVTFEGRMGYTLFGSSKLEGRLTLQLPDSFRIAAAASANPGRMGTGGAEPAQVTVTLERVIHSRNLSPDAVFYLGFRSGASRGYSSPRLENLVVAGLSKSW